MTVVPFDRGQLQALVALIRRERVTQFQAAKLEEAKVILNGMLEALDAQDAADTGRGAGKPKVPRKRRS
jgi:hypothetical protein